MGSSPIRPLGLAVALATAALMLPASASAANPWLSMRVLNQAHQGGEDVNPSNTMYAYGTALAAGSDMLELDVHSTADHQIVVIHNETVDSTTNGSGAIEDMTLDQVQALDAAHWFVPDRGTTHGAAASDYVLRGIRTGQRPPPPGYDPNDFRIPTLAEVLAAYPHIPINIEIKGADNAEKYRVTDDLANLLGGYPDPENLIVVSFEQSAVDRFHAERPEVPTAPGITGDAAFLLFGAPLPEGTAAIQIPYTFSPDSIGIHLGVPGIEINLAQPWVTAKAHAAGVAVQYWEVPENDAAYQQVISACGDGIMTTQPERFEDALRRFGTPRIGGQGGLDGCGNAPPSPPPGCRIGFAKLLAPATGQFVARFERWGDLRADCPAKLTLTTAGNVRPPHARPKGNPRRTKARRHRKLKPRRIRLGTVGFTAPAGRSGASATIQLGTKARKVLKRHPGIPVEVKFSGTAADASRVVPLG